MPERAWVHGLDGLITSQTVTHLLVARLACKAEGCWTGLTTANFYRQGQALLGVPACKYNDGAGLLLA